MTRLDVTRALDDPQRVAQDPVTWLPGPARAAGRSAWTTVLRVGPLHRQVTMTIGPVVRDTERVARVVSWTPGERPGDILPFEVLLPSFTGELIAEQDGIRLVGSYHPPAAWLGQVADVALRNAAVQTVKHLLDDIALALSGVTSGDRP